MELVMLTANLLVVFALELGTTTLILAVLRLRLFVGEIKMTLTCRRAWILQLRSRLWELHQRCNLRVQPSTIWNMSIRFLKNIWNMPIKFKTRQKPYMEHVQKVVEKTYGTCPSGLFQCKLFLSNLISKGPY